MGIMERLRFGSRNWAKTIAVVEPPPRLRDAGLLHGERRAPGEEAGTVRQDTFKVRLAHDAERTREARFLVEKRYSDVGYQLTASTARQICPERITLGTYKGDEVVGTLTIGFDTGQGLLVDELYKAEIDALRAQDGRRICEFTKLAIDTKKASKRVLASLFNVAYLYAVKIWHYTDIVIEVNPSHASFYQRMLGFTELAGERYCPRVGAPAVLLRLETAHARHMAETHGGRAGDPALPERSLYPYFMPLDKERALLERMARG